MLKKVRAFYDLAFDYHISATTLWTQIQTNPYLFNPISYLLRHTIELQLKGLIISELTIDNKSLKIEDIRVLADNNSTRKLTNIHSLLTLWEYYKVLLQQHNKLIDSESKKFIDRALKKIDKKDFSSTKYRYPFEKSGKANCIEPVEIELTDKAPDLALGIPYIIQSSSNVSIVNKGAKLLQDTSLLFDVVELLFQPFE